MKVPWYNISVDIEDLDPVVIFFVGFLWAFFSKFVEIKRLSEQMARW